MEPLLEVPGELPPEPQHMSNSNPSLNVTNKLDQQRILSSSATCLNKSIPYSEKGDDLKSHKKTKEDRLKKAVGRVLIALTFKRKPDKCHVVVNKNPNQHIYPPISENNQMTFKGPIDCHKTKQLDANPASPLAGPSKLDQIPEVRVFRDSNIIGSLEDLTLMNLARLGSRRDKWSAEEIKTKFSPQLPGDLLDDNGRMGRKETARTLSSMPSSFDEDDVIIPVKQERNVDKKDTAKTFRSELPNAYFERRKAIFDMTGLNDCDRNSTTTKESSTYKRERKQSSAELGVNYPGDLLTPIRPRKKPLTSRNTIADFAASRVRQTSTISLLSTTDQEKKTKAPFSLIKRIDKKCHSRSKDGDFVEILQNLKRSEFKDDFLEKFKKARWYNLLSTTKPQPTLFAPTSADDDYEDGDSSDSGRRRSDDINDRKEESEAQMLASGLSDVERKRREAVWELFTSECIFLIDHLMVLKHCFMEPLKECQVEGHLMVAEPRDLFGNLDEVCLVTHTFCVEFIKMLLKEATESEVGQTKVLLKALFRFCQLTRDGEVYHEYCLNYSKAMNCLELLRKNEDFVEFEKWCARDSRCHRLYLTDLLIAPMQHCTKVPLLLSNIIKYTEDENDRQSIRVTSQKLEASLKNLEAKMSWLKNFERMQEIQSQIIWLPITELEPKSYIPEFIRPLLYRQPCERLLANPTRQLLYEGSVSLIEISKTVDMYLFLFDDILLLTKVKKGSKKVTCTNLAPKIINKNVGGECSSAYHHKLDGTFLVVHRQPISLDRFVIHSVQSSDVNDSWFTQASAPEWVTNPQQSHPTGQKGFHNFGSDYYHLFDVADDEVNSVENFQTTRSSILTACVPSMTAFLKNSFVIIQITRFQQIIAVYTLQAPNEASKIAWTSRIAAAQHRYNQNYKSRSSSSSLVASPTQEFEDCQEINNDGLVHPSRQNVKRPLQRSKSPDGYLDHSILNHSSTKYRDKTYSQDTEEEFGDAEAINGEEDNYEIELEEESRRKKDKHAKSRTAKQRDSEIGLLDDVFESFGDQENQFIGRFRTKTLSKRNKHHSRHFAEDTKSLGASVSRHNLCGSAFTGCSGFGLKKSVLTSSILSNQFSPYAGLANSSYDTFDSFSVNRFDIHERRPALHVESVDLPPSLDALVAASMPAYTTNAQVSQRKQAHVTQRSHPNIQDRSLNRYRQDLSTSSKDIPIISTFSPIQLKFGPDDFKQSFPSPKIDIVVSHAPPQGLEKGVPELVITTSEKGEMVNQSIPKKQALRSTSSVPLASEFPCVPRPRPLKPNSLLKVEDSPSKTTAVLQPPGSHPKLTATLSLGPKVVPVGNLISIEPLLTLESFMHSSADNSKPSSTFDVSESMRSNMISSSQALCEYSSEDRFNQGLLSDNFLKTDPIVLRTKFGVGLQKTVENNDNSLMNRSLLQPPSFKMATTKSSSSVALDSSHRFQADKQSSNDVSLQNLDVFDTAKSPFLNRALSNDAMLNFDQCHVMKPCQSTIDLDFSEQYSSMSLLSNRQLDPKGATRPQVESLPKGDEQKNGRSRSLRCRIPMDTISEKTNQSKALDHCKR